VLAHLLVTLRIVVVTQLVCVVAYTGVVLGFARLVTPRSAEGSLVDGEDGHPVGSALVAQAFTSPRYFWPRPSACNYDASAAAGSNLSPTSPRLRERAQELLGRLGATPERPAPADLVAASGSGLDPHITVRAARYQVPRIAAARGVDPARIEELIDQQAFSPGLGIGGGEPIVNVLLLDRELDLVRP
jgi:K+-transporting ATPase ATPase C chain